MGEQLKRYAAPWLYTMHGEQGMRPLRNGGVALDEHGVVREVFTMDAAQAEKAGVTFLQGVLVPGFVNAHTHMELSFFDGVFLPGGSMVAFLRQIDDLRIDIDPEHIESSLQAGYAAMEAEGQVAYADISNAADTVNYKRTEPFESVSFVEMFGVNTPLAEKAFAEGERVLRTYHEAGVKQAYLTPHATYSVGKRLWELLTPSLDDAPIFSFHFAETYQEIEFMETGHGAMENLYANIWKRETDVPSMEEIVAALERWERAGKRMLLVHCAAIPREYVKRLVQACSGASFVLCPASNLFIGGRMPDIGMFIEEGINVAIGTDSLSSSPTLSMLDQLRLIQRYNPQVELGRMLYWATAGGAQACGFSSLGAIREGVAPGVNLLQGPKLVTEGSLEGVKSRPLSNRLACLV